MKTRTQWFTKGNPVHVGWYERDYRSLVVGTSLESHISLFANLVPDYWDGWNWFEGDGSGAKDDAISWFIPWRGLAVNPKAKGE